MQDTYINAVNVVNYINALYRIKGRYFSEVFKMNKKEKREKTARRKFEGHNKEDSKQNEGAMNRKPGVIWLNFFRKELNAKGAQVVASHEESFVIPDRNGNSPQFSMPHPCLHPLYKPLFTTKNFGDVHTVTALKFEVEKRNVNGTGIVIIDSEVSMDYEEAKKNKVVIMFRDNSCHFIWIEDEKKRTAILYSLNHAEKVMQGTRNSWKHKYNSGILKTPEYSMLDKEDIFEAVSNAFDKPLFKLMEEVGKVSQNNQGQQVITMGVT